MKRIGSLFLFITVCVFGLNAQMAPGDENEAFTSPSDTLNVVTETKRHSPTKAAILSLVLPGAGQVYNKKYWKVPIVYAGLAGLSTWVGFSVKDVRGYTKAYKLAVDGDPTTNGSYKGYTEANQLRSKREDARRNLDLSAILLSVFYALQIVDATVDAHLFEYSITDDLTVDLSPQFDNYQVMNKNTPVLGISFGLHLDTKKTMHKPSASF